MSLAFRVVATVDGINIARRVDFFDQMFMGFWHTLYIRRLPGPYHRFLPGCQPSLSEDLKDVQRKTYQKPNKEKTYKNIKFLSINVVSYIFLFFIAIIIPSTVGILGILPSPPRSLGILPPLPRIVNYFLNCLPYFYFVPAFKNYCSRACLLTPWEQGPVGKGEGQIILRILKDS